MPKRGAFKGGRNWNQGNRYSENKFDGEFYVHFGNEIYACCSAILCVCFFPSAVIV